MSLTASEMTPADIAAVNGNCGGFGDGNGAFWLIILFLFAFSGGWGNGFGGNGGVGSEVQRGFDQSATMNAIAGLQNTTATGFANAEVAGCNRAMDAMQTAYNNQIASMNQSFANAQNLDNNLNMINASLQNCCCENRANIADLKYTVATEACADRSAISEALRDVIEANTASTQRILDQMCNDKIDAKNERIQQLEAQLNFANLQASQNAQTSAILANNEAQTTALEQYLNPAPIPAYVVANPNCCTNTCNCGCGNV